MIAARGLIPSDSEVENVDQQKWSAKLWMGDWVSLLISLTSSSDSRCTDVFGLGSFGSTVEVGCCSLLLLHTI